MNKTSLPLLLAATIACSASLFAGPPAQRSSPSRTPAAEPASAIETTTPPTRIVLRPLGRKGPRSSARPARPQPAPEKVLAAGS